MSVESSTVQPPPTGSIRGTWREKHGDQRVNITVNPDRLADEFRVALLRRWGPGHGDVKSLESALSRQGAETLRDALTVALDWQPGGAA